MRSRRHQPRKSCDRLHQFDGVPCQTQPPGSNPCVGFGGPGRLTTAVSGEAIRADQADGQVGVGTGDGGVTHHSGASWTLFDLMRNAGARAPDRCDELKEQLREGRQQPCRVQHQGGVCIAPCLRVRRARFGHVSGAGRPACRRLWRFRPRRRAGVTHGTAQMA